MEADDDWAVRVKNLSKNFGSLPVLKDISFEVKRGEIVSILGPSGSGKTTLLKMIAGLLPPTSGEISVYPTCKKRMVFQEPPLLPWRTAQQNIDLPLELSGEPINRQKTQDILEKVSLVGFHDSYPQELSLGMQQRVAIAQALVMKPQILLMDEPFSALDELTRERMYAELHNYFRDSSLGINSIIFVTHSIPEAVYLSDKIVILSDRPATIKSIISVNLGKRTAKLLESQKFYQVMKKVRKCLKK